MSSAITTVPDFDALSSADDYVETIQRLLADGEAGAARRAAALAAARFPNHPWITKANRVINPHRIVSRPATAPDRSLEFAWLRKNSGHYQGQWIALLGDELLAASNDFEDVLRVLRSRELEDQALVHHVV